MSRLPEQKKLYFMLPGVESGKPQASEDSPCLSYWEMHSGLPASTQMGLRARQQHSGGKGEQRCRVLRPWSGCQRQAQAARRGRLHLFYKRPQGMLGRLRSDCRNSDLQTETEVVSGLSQLKLAMVSESVDLRKTICYKKMIHFPCCLEESNQSLHGGIIRTVWVRLIK